MITAYNRRLLLERMGEDYKYVTWKRTQNFKKRFKREKCGGGISTYAESLASPAIGTNTVTHNLGTTDITVQLWLEGTGDMITTKITNRTANSVDIVWSSAPGDNIRVVVQG